MERRPGLDAALVVEDGAILPAAPAARDLPPADLDPAAIAGLPVHRRGAEPATVEALLRRHHARGLVVVHRGRLAYEWFAGDPARRRPCFSVTKSFTGTLAALAVHEGVLDRGALAGELLPELAGSGFADATVGQVADMTVSVAYTEDYGTGDDPPSPGGSAVLGFNDYLAALRPDGPWSLRRLLARMGPGPEAHGEVFDYATPKTDVLGWALERARGRGYVELLTDAVWDGVGAEHDGALALAPDGVPMLGAGLAVTTRDLARAGLALLERVPPAVLTAMRSGGSTTAFARGGHYDYLAGYAYADQWWLPDAGQGARPLSAWGIHGQLLWLDPDADLVIACHSAGPAPSDPTRDVDHDAICRALTNYFNRNPSY